MATVDERARHQLYLAAEHTLGAEEAATLMSMLPPVGWADVATKQNLTAVEVALRQDLTRLKQDLNALEVALKQDLVSLRQDLENVIEAKLQRQDAKMEHRFHEMTRTFVTWMLASQATTVTLVVAALAIFR